MEGRGSSPLAVAAVAAALGGALLLGACGDDEQRFSDKKIVDALGLEEAENAYAIGGDPFCQVSTELLNDSSEVEDADGGEKSLVISSAEGNVAIEGVPPFASDCQRVARKGLNKLDPRSDD